MSDYPVVTIITPTYNRANLLPETINSVLSQDYPNIEYIILDDGSTDNSLAVVKEYIEAHPDIIQYFYHDNIGEAETVNKGWKLAKGEYFIIVNSDDPILPGLVSESVNAMKKFSNTIVTYPNWYATDEKGKVKDTMILKQYQYKQFFSNACLIGPGAMINRRQLLNNLEYLRTKKYPLISDFESWLRVCQEGKMLHINKILATHREHSGALTARHVDQIGAQWEDCLIDFFDNVQNKKYYFLKEEALLCCYLILFRRALTGHRIQSVFYYYYKALQNNPIAINKLLFVSVFKKTYCLCRSLLFKVINGISKWKRFIITRII